MNVLHVVGGREDIGGILSVLRNLHALGPGSGLRHQVLVHQNYVETRAPALDYVRSRHLLDESPRHLRLLRAALPALRELRALVRGERIDVLHAHTRGALPVAVGVDLLWRRRLLFTSHTYGRRKTAYRWAARRKRLRFSVLTPNMARHYGIPLGPTGAAVVSECCGDRFFAQPLVERPPLEAQRPIRLVGLGNIVGWKNWHLVLLALAQLPAQVRERFTFDHWGPVPDSADCRRLRNELAELAHRAAPARCEFHGLSLNVEEPLRQADWFVIPSTNEPCSVALIEALALGLPAIASASGGNVDILAPGRTGLLFKPDDAADFSAHLIRLARGEAAAVEPAAVRASVRHRCAAQVAAQYAHLYQEVRFPAEAAVG